MRLCATKNCHNTAQIFKQYCAYCSCLFLGCRKLTEPYSYCEEHRCPEPGCCRGKEWPCEGNHYYRKGERKCRLCDKIKTSDSLYCNEHTCLKYAVVKVKKDGRSEKMNLYCNEKVKLGHRACDKHLQYCEEPLCMNLHSEKGSRCKRHSEYYYYNNDNYSCGSTECRTCPTRKNFVGTFLTFGLDCGFPVVEAVIKHSTFPS
jgi:hypothetical protein